MVSRLEKLSPWTASLAFARCLSYINSRVLRIIHPYDFTPSSLYSFPVTISVSIMVSTVFSGINNINTVASDLSLAFCQLSHSTLGRHTSYMCIGNRRNTYGHSVPVLTDTKAGKIEVLSIRKTWGGGQYAVVRTSRDIGVILMWRKRVKVASPRALFRKADRRDRENVSGAGRPATSAVNVRA